MKSVLKPFIFLTTITAVLSAKPDSGFHLTEVIAGYARGCSGIDTIGFSLNSDALTYSFSEYESSYPDTTQTGSDVVFCVMEQDIGRTPGNWRFAIDSVQFDGHAKLSGGGQIKQLFAIMSIQASYVTNPGASLSEEKWALNEQSMGTYGIYNSTLSSSPARDDGQFSLIATEDYNQTNWSPCFTPGANRDETKFQFSLQNVLFLGQEDGATNPKAEFAKDLKTKLAFKWEACDSSVDAYASWGDASTVPDGWNPYKKNKKRLRVLG